MGTASGVKRIENEYSDRLSRLSDELIVSVLSLLPAKEVAQTCILSKRWRNLWAAVPSLCFDVRDWNNDFKKFMGFVCNFLLKRDKTIDTQIFHILCQDCSGIVSSEVNEWITYAVEHNPKILKLSFSDYDGIPDCVFTCKTLESLKLKMKFWKPMDLKPSEIVCLPKLRNLTLKGIYCCTDNLEKVLLGCPILEDLRINFCTLNMSKLSYYNVKGLKILAPYTFGDETISFSAPCLENLILYCDIMSGSIILKDMPKVTRAILTIDLDVEEEYNYHLLSGLSGVKDLEISILRRPKEMLQREMQECPTFHSLKFLSLDLFCPCCGLDTWSPFIKHCPNLEELYLMPLQEPCEMDEEHKRVKKHQNLEKIEEFPCKGLKRVEIIYSKLSYSLRHYLITCIQQRTKDINSGGVRKFDNGVQ